MREMVIDLFAGGGGASLGIEQALEVPVNLAINHDEAAIAMHKANHPQTEHGCADVWSVDPVQATKGRQVGLLWGSPDCAHHSRAKGGKPRDKKIRSLAWVIVRWAKAVRPRVIMVENVCEFADWGPLDSNDMPDKSKSGTTFNLWLNQLRGLGYRVSHKELVACDYGAPTRRKRLFIVARCDNEPIVWPEPTHGVPGNLFGLAPFRTAAECIDWSIPCPSIFERQRALVENTLWRIARAMRKFVFEAKEPFIVGIDNQSAGGTCGWGVSEPLRTVTMENRFALVSPTMVQIGYGERQGQEPRCLDIQEPLGTVIGAGKHALVAAFLQKYFGGVLGADLRQPAPTVTAIDHNALVTSHLLKLYGTTTGQDMREPMPTVTGGRQHIAEVRAFLLKYYAAGVGQSLREPLHTATARARFGLVMIYGTWYQITDIGLRMLSPRELARATGVPDSYILTGSNTSQVARIGNMVPPAFAKALVTANVRLRDVAEVKVRA